MSAASLPPYLATAEALPRKRFTRDEVERYLEAGFFDGQRFELIDGDLIDKMGQKPPHANGIRRVQGWLTRLFGVDRVQAQLPIEAAPADRERSLPEPDIAVLAEPNPGSDNRHPRGDELLLVVEVSDSTVAFDLSRKAALYANASVPEYWVLDLPRRAVVVHRRPDGSAYRLMQLFFESDSVSMEGGAETVRVSDLLPPRA